MLFYEKIKIIVLWIVIVIILLKLRKILSRKITTHDIFCDTCLKVTQHENGKCIKHN